MADCVTPRRKAARLALDSSCRASKVLSRLRSTCAIFIWLISFSTEVGFIHDPAWPENGQPPLTWSDMMPVSTVAALQIGSLPGGKAETLEQILAYEGDIQRSGAQLVVMPEALLG